MPPSHDLGRRQSVVLSSPNAAFCCRLFPLEGDCRSSMIGELRRALAGSAFFRAAGDNASPLVLSVRLFHHGSPAILRRAAAWRGMNRGELDMTVRVDASAATVHWGYLHATLAPAPTVD